MRRLKLGLLLLLVAAGLTAYGAHLARLTNAGYCFAAGKYLSNEEKVRVALGGLLRKYPPAVEKRKHHPEAKVIGFLPPERPIFYSDVDEFLSLNPDCCKFIAPTKFREGNGQFTLLERVRGAATDLIEVTYRVRYRDKDNTLQAIETTEYFYITSCGTPGDPPYVP